LLSKYSQGYKQSIRNNIFSAKLLLAYPAKELVKSLLPRAFTYKEGGAGQPKVEIATFSRQVESFCEILNLLTNSYDFFFLVFIYLPFLDKCIWESLGPE